jgi:transcriptional regulator with XRE-family HTH domain
MKLSEFGRELRNLRLDRELTLTDLAKKLNCSVAYLSAVERGIKGPTAKLVDTIQELFGLNSAESRRLAFAAQRSRKSLLVDRIRGEDARLFTIFAHQVSTMNGEESAILEKAISDEATFKLLLDFAKKVLCEQERRRTTQLSLDVEFDGLEHMTVMLKRTFTPHVGRSVPPLSKDFIAREALRIRRWSKCGESEPFDVVNFLDVGLERVCGYEYRVIEDEIFLAHLLARNWAHEGVVCVQAYTDPFLKEIVIRQSVFNRACEKEYSLEMAAARFTIAHEIGHALLHDELYDAGEHRVGEAPPYVDSEWQANVAARYVLISKNSGAHFHNANDLAKGLMVTPQCANHHWAAHCPGVLDRRQMHLFG